MSMPGDDQLIQSAMKAAPQKVSAAATIVGGLLNKQKAPATAAYTPVNPSQVESQTINADLSNQGSAQQLAGSSNTFNSSQALQMLNTALPGYSGLASSLMGNAQSIAADPYAVPKSVTDQLTQYAAENNIQAGTGASSGFSGSNMLRSLGINALQYGQTNMQTAMSALSTLTGTAPQVSPTSPLSFMLSPSSVLQTQTQNNTMQQNVAQGANNASAAAGNANSSNLWDSITSGGNSLAMQELMQQYINNQPAKNPTLTVPGAIAGMTDAAPNP